MTSSFSTLLFFLLAATGHFLASGSPTSSLNLNSQDQVESEYDYVIVGGGTAGLTVADRLTESGKYTVLVIEYGEFDNSSSVSTVAGGIQSYINATHLWQIPSTPQPGMNNRTQLVVLGKMLGGSSAANGLGYLRGQIEDYDSWASLFGGRSDWDWKGLLPYFRKASTFTPPPEALAKEFNIKYDRRFWGTAGTKIFATLPSFQWPQLKTNFKAYQDIPGATYPPDSGSGLPGAFWFPSSYDPVTVTRSFSRTGHWDSLNRPNYQTITGSRVIKINFRGNQASGVQFVPSSATAVTAINVKTAKARKEVILSAGAIHSPQILQASGIGPKSILQAANIPLKVELPGVGQNFQDHQFNPGHNFRFENFTAHPSPEDLEDPAFAAAAQQQFDQNKTGPLAVAAGNSAAFLPLSVIAPATFSKLASTFESTDPAAYLPQNTHPTVIAGYKAQQSILANVFRSKGSATYNIQFAGGSTEGASVNLRPVSRGTVNIDPRDPVFLDPIVDYRALTNPTDLAVLIEIMRFTRRYMATSTLAASAPREISPGANVTSDKDLGDFIRGVLWPTVFHPIGTCAMSPKHLGGVVDTELRVYGTRGLRVVDASVMPLLPGAYTQQSTYAIAEKAADLIKAAQ